MYGLISLAIVVLYLVLCGYKARSDSRNLDWEWEARTMEIYAQSQQELKHFDADFFAQYGEDAYRQMCFSREQQAILMDLLFTPASV